MEYQQYYYEHTFRTVLIRSSFFFLPCVREYKVYSTQTAMTDVVPRSCFLNLAYASQRKICFTCHWVGLHFLGGDELQNVSKTFPLKYYGRNNDPNIHQMPTHSSPCYTDCTTKSWYCAAVYKEQEKTGSCLWQWSMDYWRTLIHARALLHILFRDVSTALWLCVVLYIYICVCVCVW